MLELCKTALHVIHLWKLLDKMYKYQMDPASIVEDREQTQFCPQMDDLYNTGKRFAEMW